MPLARRGGGEAGEPSRLFGYSGLVGVARFSLATMMPCTALFVHTFLLTKTPPPPWRSCGGCASGGIRNEAGHSA